MTDRDTENQIYGDEKHRWEIIFSRENAGRDKNIVKWCRRCGAVITEETTGAGRVVTMRKPEPDGPIGVPIG